MAATGQTTSEAQREAVSVEYETERTQAGAVTLTETASDEEVVTTEREFDTALPVDPATGTPPLKRQTTQTRRRVDAGRQTQATEVAADRQRDATETTAESGHDESALQVDAAEKRGMNALQQTLCAIGVAALIAGLVWLILKVKRMLKPF